MHITTFYSFKGGVGRTQALVNVGVELAQRGRRVLLVDFDLEAPGIDTYPLPKPTQQGPGLLEFITEYSESGAVPDASKHIYECPIRSEGRLWIMPAGRQDATYARRLSEIDWETLYSEKRGFLLFEDLKLQWEQTLSPDYVLIDSRTGHTDVTGICTRQLPHSVVVVFFPTDQNLRGLPKVVDDIRLEAGPPREKRIGLLFVMSNIPDLDDEDQILERRIQLFAETLHYDTLSAVIHRYDSLALLNQVVFSADRPKSRLAREYQTLADKIIEQNLGDREGALAFIKKISGATRTGAIDVPRTEVESRLQDISKSHGRDPEVLEQLADLRMQDARYEEAEALWDSVLELKGPTGHVFLRRAESRLSARHRDAALKDVEAALQAESGVDYEVARAVRLLASLAPDRLRSVTTSPAVQHLNSEGRMLVAVELGRHEQGLGSAREIYEELYGAPDLSEKLRTGVGIELSVTLIALGQFDEAMTLLSTWASNETHIAAVFNYAVAKWALDQTPPRDLFERVVVLDSGRERDAPNYSQCLAVALAVVGRTEEAEERLRRARQMISGHRQPTLSCWRYRVVSPAEFSKDLDAIQRFIRDSSIRPRFLDYANHVIRP